MSEPRAALAKGLVFVGAATMIGNGAAFLLTMIAARVLTPDEFGALGALLGMLVIISTISIATQALTARRVIEMRPRVQAVADRLLDAVADKGRMEVIHAFAYRFPTLVMCDMLGLSPEEASDEVLVALKT